MTLPIFFGVTSWVDADAAAGWHIFGTLGEGHELVAIYLRKLLE